MTTPQPWIGYVKDLCGTVETQLQSGLTEEEAGTILAQLPTLDKCRRGILGHVIPSNVELLHYWISIFRRMQEHSNSEPKLRLVKIPLSDLLTVTDGNNETFVKPRSPQVVMFSKTYFIKEYFNKRHGFLVTIDAVQTTDLPSSGWFGKKTVPEETGFNVKHYDFYLTVGWKNVTIMPAEMETWNTTAEPNPPPPQ